MGSFNFRCVACHYPIVNHMECVSFWIEQGVRRDDLMLAGKYDDSLSIIPSEMTARFMSETELEQRQKIVEELWEINRLKSYSDSKETNTGPSMWHRHCFEEEINIEDYAIHALEKLEHNREYERDKEQLEKNILAIQKQRENPLGGELLRKKGQEYSLLDQNIVSQRGQMHTPEAVWTMIRHLKNLQKFKYAQEPIFGSHYLETPGYIYEPEQFSALLADLELSSEILQRAADIAKEQEEDN